MEGGSILLGCVCKYVHEHACAREGQTLTYDVFFSSPHYCLRQGLSLNLRLADSVAGQQPRAPPGFTSPALE